MFIFVIDIVIVINNVIVIVINIVIVIVINNVIVIVINIVIVIVINIVIVIVINIVIDIVIIVIVLLLFIIIVVIIVIICYFSDLEFHWNGDRMVQSEYEEEEMRRTSVPFISRFVRCISCHGNTIYWGDDGTNLKMLQWKKG